MIESLAILLLSSSLGVLVWQLAERENQAELARAVEDDKQFIQSVGGMDSPWVSDARKSASKQFWSEFDGQYSPDEQIAIERDPMWGVPISATPQPVSDASPQPSQHISTHEATTAAPPAVEAVEATGYTTGGWISAEVFLSANSLVFPIAIPPVNIEYPKDKRALIVATSWITKALDAGVSQNKIVSDIFQKSKGTADYERIVEIIRSIKG